MPTWICLRIGYQDTSLFDYHNFSPFRIPFWGIRVLRQTHIVSLLLLNRGICIHPSDQWRCHGENGTLILGSIVGQGACATVRGFQGLGDISKGSGSTALSWKVETISIALTCCLAWADEWQSNREFLGTSWNVDGSRVWRSGAIQHPQHAQHPQSVASGLEDPWWSRCACWFLPLGACSAWHGVNPRWARMTMDLMTVPWMHEITGRYSVARYSRGSFSWEGWESLNSCVVILGLMFPSD